MKKIITKWATDASGNKLYNEDGSPKMEIVAIEEHAVSLTDLAENWQESQADYMQFLETLKGLVETRGYEKLALEDRKLAAKAFVLTDAQIKQELSLNEEIEASIIHNQLTMQSRKRRWEILSNLFKTLLPTADNLELTAALQEKGLQTMYVELGVEGKGVFNYKGEENPDGILDFLRSTGRFAAAGLASLGLNPERGVTVPDLVSKSVAVITEGILPQ
jgi:hypothetical protein